MTFQKLASVSLLITLAFQSAHTQTFLTPENNKEGGLKSPEKRTNNFRVPVETPFDPNFWPARGRRSRKDPEMDPQPENCMTSDKRCRQALKIYEEGLNRRSPPDFDIIPPIELDDEMSAVEKPDSNCYGNGKQRSMGALRGNLPKGYDEMRHKKQRHSALPQLILYGNGVYWEPENLYGEKKKKQDVFWVARGKKNFNFQKK